MRFSSWILFCGLVLTGCATGTPQTRRQERQPAYQALSADEKQMVDQGQIKVGMSQDAVYIAWGEPSDVLNSETPQGRITTWLYYGTAMLEDRYWRYGRTARLTRDFYPQDYVQYEVVFAEGKVVRWQTLPKPLN